MIFVLLWFCKQRENLQNLRHFWSNSKFIFEKSRTISFKIVDILLVKNLNYNLGWKRRNCFKKVTKPFTYEYFCRSEHNSFSFLPIWRQNKKFHFIKMWHWHLKNEIPELFLLKPNCQEWISRNCQEPNLLMVSYPQIFVPNVLSHATSDPSKNWLTLF